jgi:ribosome maturation protein Sdo1
VAQGVFCSTDQEWDRSVILVASDNVSFQLILMFELKNMAALEGLRAKEDAALQKVFGTNFEQASKDLAAKRVEMREIYGTKVVREIALK